MHDAGARARTSRYHGPTPCWRTERYTELSTLLHTGCPRISGDHPAPPSGTIHITEHRTRKEGEKPCCWMITGTTRAVWLWGILSAVAFARRVCWQRPTMIRSRMKMRCSANRALVRSERVGVPDPSLLRRSDNVVHSPLTAHGPLSPSRSFGRDPLAWRIDGIVDV